MPSYMIRDLPAGLIGRAKARARSTDTTLDTVLLRLLTSYADAGMPGQAGAEARRDRLTAEERSASARRAADSRWRREKSE